MEGYGVEGYGVEGYGVEGYGVEVWRDVVRDVWWRDMVQETRNRTIPDWSPHKKLIVVGNGKGFTFTTPQASPPHELRKGRAAMPRGPFAIRGVWGDWSPHKKNKNLIVVSLDGLEGMEVEFFEGGGIFSVLPAGDVCEVLVIAGAFTGGRLVFGSEVAPA